MPVKIAVPIAGGGVSDTLETCEAVNFYEDDHGRVTRQFTMPAERGGALELIERHGVDILICGALPAEERRALALSGLLLAPAVSNDADQAVKAYLSMTIVCDPGNTCNYCGFRNECAWTEPTPQK